MRRTKKALDEQVIVVTGASSGIGLATARSAAERGAAVVMAARSPATERLASELRERGFRVEAVIADVSREDDVRRIADRAEAAYGRIDTWINNAGEALYGRAAELPVDVMKRLFDTNFWGVVHGSQIAVARMRDAGGTLINMGSLESDRAVPLQSAYAASKHAIKAFTDALRMELEHDGLPIQVTLIKPAAIDTPLFAHAKSYVGVGTPEAPPPVYAPEIVARALLDCATRPRREVAVGGAARAEMVAGRWLPALADRVLAHGFFESQFRSTPHEARVLGAGEVHGDYEGKVLQRSAYTRLRTAPRGAQLALGAAAVLAFAGVGAALLGAARLAARPRARYLDGIAT